MIPEQLKDWDSEFIKQLINIGYEEDEKIEYKEFLDCPNKVELREYKIKIEELICSFSNSKGGFIIFGMSDDRKLKGVNIEDDGEINLKISQIVSNTKPNINVATKK